MSFSLRETAGWLLILFGLVLIRTALGFVESRQVVEAGIVVMASGIVFRAGTYLIRLATASRICTTARRLEKQSAS